MPDEIEDWARQVIEATERGQHFEDGVVELKSDWAASSFETARQLAAQANAVAGNPMLWLIGVKQGKGVVGVSPRDLADWWPQIRMHFDKVAPRLLADRILNYPNGNVVALLFDPSDPPYVIVYPQGEHPTKRAIRREVPWREGTAMRSADRDDLLRVLQPQTLAPEIRAIPGLMSVLSAEEKTDESTDRKLQWFLRIRIFVNPRSNQPVVFTATDPPLARIHFAERDIVLRPFPLAPSAGGLVALGGSEVIFRGAASLDMLSMDGLTEVFGRQAEKIMMTFSWKAVGAFRASETEIEWQRSSAPPQAWDRWEAVFPP